MIKIGHPRTATFPASGSRLSDLSYAARFGNHVPFFRIARDEFNEGLSPGIIPDILGLAAEQRRFRYGDESSCHRRTIRQWRPNSREKTLTTSQNLREPAARRHPPAARHAAVETGGIAEMPQLPLRAVGAHDEVDRNAGDHAVQVGASERREASE